MSENLFEIQERKQLVKSFYAAYDAAILLQSCALIINGKSNAVFEGAGRHFEVYKTSVRGFDFALCFPQQDFQKKRLTGIKSWPDLMTQLKTIKNPLIPPFELLALKDINQIVLIQPFGQLKKKIDTDSSSVNKLINNLHEQLKSQKLSLGDIPQIRYYGELPFIHDYSELHELPPSPSS